MRKPAKNRNSRQHFISAFPDRPIVCESRASSIHGAEACVPLEIFRVLAKRERAVPVVYGCCNSQSSQQLVKSFHFQTTRVIFAKARRKGHPSIAFSRSGSLPVITGFMNG
jgi:hypothetical protein